MTATGNFTLGVEEEYLIVDPESRAPLPDAERLLDPARQELGPHVHSELQLSQLEVSTGVCAELGDVRAELTRLRRGLAAVAASNGAAIAAAGTHPFASWRDGQITPREAYLQLARDYQQLAREQLICGCHVHVGIEDPEEAIQVLNRVRPWLSALVALAANSPFWMGTDTGYASYRTEVWRRWPMAGTPDTFEDRSEYDRLIDVLLATESVDAPARVYFDVRPSARFATLEFRVTDVCLTVDDAVMIAGLIRGVAHAAHDEVLAGQPLPAFRAELLRAATWRAARHGVEAELLHVACGRAAPAPEVVGPFWPSPAGRWRRSATGTRSRLWWSGPSPGGNGAVRQRQVFSRAGKLDDVVDFVVAETKGPPTG